MVVDLSLKPSLATFPFRDNSNEPPIEAALHRAEDGHDALLAMMDSQAELANKKLRCGEVKQAMRILHQAYSMVEAYVESFPSAEGVPPAAMLAAATIRLSLCVTLSGVGRHTQALDEAKMAAVEIDKMWRLLFLSSAEQEEATAFGDKTKPAASLRDALRNPPQWLERAVEVAVQARHCIALELEFENGPLTAESRSCLLGASSALSTGLEAGVSDASDPVDEEVPDPVPLSEAATIQEQIGKLHREGVLLARQLLPAEHAVRHHAELAFTKWVQRTGGDGLPDLSESSSPVQRTLSRRRQLTMVLSKEAEFSPPASQLGPAPPTSPPQPLSPKSPSRPPPLNTCRSAPLDTDLPQFLRLHAKGRLPAPSATWPATSIQTTNASTASLASINESSGSGLPRSLSSGTVNPSQFTSQLSYHSAPGGDVYMASLPKHSNLPQIKKKKGTPPLQGSRSPSKAHGSRSSSKDEKRQNSKERKERLKQEEQAAAEKPQRAKTAQQKAQEAAILAAQRDPFEDWRRNMVDERQMSFFQQKLKTNQGLTTLQNDLKDEARRFKSFTMKELDDAAMFEIRTKFGPSGMRATHHADKRMDAFKKENWSITDDGMSRTETKAHLFQYFNTKVSGEQPTAGQLSQVLSKSQTHGANLDKIAKEEMKRQEEERLRAKKLKKKEGLLGYIPKKQAGSPPTGRSEMGSKVGKSPASKK
jgi:hypothetical protein